VGTEVQSKIPVPYQRPKKQAPVFERNFQALSLFRIGFAAYLLVHFCFHDLNFFNDFYTDNGILPLSALATDPLAGVHIVVPVLYLLEAGGLNAMLPVLFPIAVIAFGIGLRTRASNATVFALSSYLFWRNPYIRNGAEYLSHLLQLWCLFLPLNRYWSIDAALDRQPRNRSYPLLPFLAMRLQVSSLYVFAGIFKLASLEWIDGNAVAWSLQDNIFGAQPVGLWMLTHFPMLIFAANYLIIAFQLTFPLLIYFPWHNDLIRAASLAFAAAIHLTFIFCLNVGGFPYLCLLMLLVLIPDAWIERLLYARRERLQEFVIFFEPGCIFCHRIALVLREFLVSPMAAILPASKSLMTEHQTWVVRDAAGGLHVKWRGMAILLKQTFIFFPLGWLSEQRILLGPLDRLYDAIGRNRCRLHKIAGVPLPFREWPAISQVAQALCILLAALALFTNISGIQRPAITASPLTPKVARPLFNAPYWIRELTVDLQVWQSWPLFVPPPHWRRGYRITVQFTDGLDVDLMEHLPVRLYRAVNNDRLEFADDRWLKYFTQFDLLTDADWAAFGQYLCSQARDHIVRRPPPVGIELTSTTWPIANTSEANKPADQDRHFDCGDK
jgi:hypothetical protein